MATIPETLTSSQAQKRPVYACLPYKVIKQPPIRHRHTKARRRSLSPFEYAVMGGLMIMARTSLSDDKSRRAWAAGSKGHRPGDRVGR
jgi:hypothetical protein